MLLIPDVSEWQPNTNMAGIKAQNGGVAIIRACYGTGHVDKVFAKLRAAAHSAGFRALGIYHYIVPTADATLQAEFFCRTVGKLRAGEFAILDLEEGSGNQASRAKSWLSYVDGKLGGKAWLYAGESFYTTHGLSAATGGRNVWIAAYRSSEPTVAHTLWQCSDGKAGAHITAWSGAGKCDTSVHNGTLASFLAAIGGKPAPEEDDVPKYVSVGVKQPVKVTKDKAVNINFDVEYDDAGGQHANGSYPGVLTKPCTAIVEVTASGVGGTSELVAHDMKSGKDRSLGVHPLGGPYTAVVKLYVNDHLYVRVTGSADGSVTAYAKAAYWLS